MSVPNATLWVGLVCLGAVACGARSDVQCFGGECIGGAGASTGASDPDDDDDGVVVPPFMNPRRPPRDVPDPPPPSMEMRPDEDLPVSSTGELCPNGGSAQGPIVIDRARDLEQLRRCRQVIGDLGLIGFVAPDLEPLSALERVTGTLFLGISARLDGLQALQQVGRLELDGLQTPTLEPLQNLRRIGVVDGDSEATLEIRDTSGFGDLSGLSRMAPLRGTLLIVRNPQLSSLRGLPLADSMRELLVSDNVSLRQLGVDPTLVSLERLALQSSAQLADLTSLANLQRADILELEEIGIQSLDALQALTETTDISLRGNEQLSDVQRLASVRFQSLRVVRNAALTSLPEFSLPLELQQVQFRENAQLVTAPSFPNLSSARRILISENPGITRIAGFPSLTSIGTFEVRENPNLVELDLGALQSYEVARIVCNPLFPESSIAPYLEPRGGQLEMRGNFGSTLPCN